jgi:hypothetical protein
MADAKGKEVSVRLTEDMRREIVRGLVNNAMSKRGADHSKATYALGLKVYNQHYTAAQRRQMAALPEGWLKEAAAIAVNVGGRRCVLSFGPLTDRYKPTVLKRLPHSGEEPIPLEARSELGAAIIALQDEGEKISEERRRLTAKAEAVLASVGTTARLAEVWPEAAPFIPKPEARLLPVIRRDELNAAFGLKALAKAEA